MTKPLDVLVLESEPHAADAAVERLQEAGHTVHRCHEPGARAFPCRALEAQGCPLDSGTVDVAVTVRARPRSVPGALEDGVSCALQHRIPLVVSGRVALNPYDEFEGVVVDEGHDVVAAIENAARSSLRQHARLALDAARTVLELRGFEQPEASAEAHRRQGVVRVDVIVADDVDRATRDMIATRAHAALRNFDRHARQIDIAVDSGH